MIERPTPETDAAERMAFAQEYIVPTAFARKLERERDQAREGQMEALCDCQRLARKIDDIRDVFDHQDEDWTGSTTLAKAVSKVIRERDEAREALRTLAEHGENEIQKLIKECDEARNKMADALQEVDLRTLDYERMKQERDEAREALENHTTATIHTCHSECKRPMCVLRRERDQARELCLKLNDLVAYGLGQSGEPWSLDAMRQATAAIQKTKQMGTLPTD